MLNLIVEREDEIMSTFAERLTEIMAKYDIGVRELSRRTGIHASDISHYRNGDYVPKQDKVYLIAKALNVSPGWLMGFDSQQLEKRLMLESLVQSMWQKLTPEQQMEVVRYMSSLIGDHKEEP